MDLEDSGAREFSDSVESKVRNKQAHQFYSNSDNLKDTFLCWPKVILGEPEKSSHFWKFITLTLLHRFESFKF